MGQEDTQVRQPARICPDSRVTSSIVSAELAKVVALAGDGVAEERPKAFTAQELAEELGKSVQTANTYLRKFAKAGKIRRGFKIRRWSESLGDWRTVPGYELIEEEVE